VSGDSLRAELEDQYPDADVHVNRDADGTLVAIEGGDWAVYAEWGPGPSVLRDVMLSRPVCRAALRAVDDGAA
jgi:hypothetical protein